MNKSRNSLKIEAFNRYLRQQDLKSTKQRYYIADVFFGVSSHISLEELLSLSRKRYPAIGYATVYRTMKLLTESGLAAESRFGEGQTRFENVPEKGHHDHIICIKCSKILEFHNEKIEELQAETAKKFGFKIVRHKLELYGYCGDCAPKSTT